MIHNDDGAKEENICPEIITKAVAGIISNWKRNLQGLMCSYSPPDALSGSKGARMRAIWWAGGAGRTDASCASNNKRSHRTSRNELFFQLDERRLYNTPLAASRQQRKWAKTTPCCRNRASDKSFFVRLKKALVRAGNQTNPRLCSSLPRRQLLLHFGRLILDFTSFIWICNCRSCIH